MKNIKVYLGGTCGDSKWRDMLIPMLNKNIIYKNPVVDSWKYTKKVNDIKKLQMNECDFLIYVITPKQTGFSSIASVVDYSNKVPEKVILCILYEFENEKFEGHKLESIKAVGDIIRNNNCKILSDLESVANYLNSFISDEG